ncbi:MAG TPA: ABC transporter ATP-binding protein [Bdellovibrionota bacterium]|nr:ABC transporter ATP-binding protein [Bdellovibrionota bacterium]
MTPAIEIRKLVKNYGPIQAVKSISFEIQSGTFFGFLGPNGAGKTTTIHILTGLCNRTSGEIRVFGKDVTTDYIDCRRRIGFGPQEFNFDRFFSIQKLLEFSAGYFGVSRKVARKRTEELLERFDLIDKRNEHAPKLSGGLKRRLLIAKALVHDPDILILDEPTAGVDIETRHEIWEYLNQLNRQGKTIFLTTHYLEEAEKLCRDIAIIHEGTIVERGLTSELMQRDGTNLERIFLRLVQNRTETNVG